MKAFLVAGKSGSGKSTFLKISNSLNIPSFDMSSVIYEEMKKMDLDLSPLNVISFADSLREKEGKDIVAKLIYKKVLETLKTEGTENKKALNFNVVAITGLRSVYELGFFNKVFERTLFVRIESSIEKRFERVIKRKKESNPLTFEEFRKKDEKENKWGMEKLLKKADIIIYNNSSLEDFENRIRRLILFYDDI